MLGVHGFLGQTVCVSVFLTCTILATAALPATTPLPQTTHIVSYVHQGRAGSKGGEISEFDYESVHSGDYRRSAAIRSTERSTPISQLYGAFIEQLDMSLDNGFSRTNTTPVISISTTESVRQTDDLLLTKQNTLENADDVFGRNEQHESSKPVTSDSHPNVSVKVWSRPKQSIPVLEPVRHLLNTVREQHNQTVHAARQHHQLLGSMMSGLAEHMPANESSAIETEEDRETANESTEFKLLDFAGSLVGMLWGFFGNLQRAFAASSGNALASTSSSSSGGQ
ncbi:uncharacterized protein LOC105208422 [Zeugodacus cucurbitae]|uniref:Glutamyl-tRNA reductase n=1 Tax=Zeugodacus cucurbitae TaxID=28588 RepID=A0A0A1WHT5_ZEUCU|nr:uncharacterized protein LOC105208422 [Zeugodacus cucurbitae]